MSSVSSSSRPIEVLSVEWSDEMTRTRLTRCGKGARIVDSARPSVIVLCRRANIACMYHGSRKRPGLRAGYVQQLEQRITALGHEFREF
jgi:hypothetical protein